VFHAVRSAMTSVMEKKVGAMRVRIAGPRARIEESMMSVDPNNSCDFCGSCVSGEGPSSADGEDV